MPERNEERSRAVRPISITTGTFFRLLFIALAAVFLYMIRDIVAMVLVSLFFAAVIDPFADFFERWRIPRTLAVILVYLLGFTLLAGGWFLVIPPMVQELGGLVSTFAPAIETVSGGSLPLQSLLDGSFTANVQSIIDALRSSGVADAVGKLMELGSTAAEIVFAVLVVLILTLYFVVEKTALVRMLSFVTPDEYQPFVMQLVGKVREKMGLWLRGQLALMLAVFLLTYGALLLLQIPYALVLAFLAGVLEIIPFAGPILSSVSAIVLGFVVSPVHAVLVAGAYLVVQQVEGNVLVPKIMQRVTGLNPIYSILAILIGWRIGNIVGAMVSIPIAMAISVFVVEVFRHGRES